MKKLIGVLLALLVLASCQVPFTGSGAIRVSLANAGGKSLVLNQDKVRIQLLRNNNIIPQGGQDYQEVTFANQTITIDQLAPGTGYKVLVVGGSYNNGFFVAKNFAPSNPFEVTAGVETAVAIDAGPTDLSVLSAGSQGAAAVVGGNLDYLSNGQIWERTGSSTSDTLQASVGTVPYVIRSFSTGLLNKNPLTPIGTQPLSYYATEQLWVNTSQGISTISNPGASGSLTAPQIGHGTSAATNPDVAFSGSIAIVNDKDINIAGGSTVPGGSTLTADYKAYFLHVYGGAGTSAGARFEKSDEPDQVWYSADDKMSSLPSFVTDILNKSGNLFLGYAKADNYALIASSLGVYRVTKTMIMDGKNKSLQYFDPAFPLGDPQDADHYRVLVGLADKDAKSQGVASSATGPGNTDTAYVYIAANRALFVAGIDPSTGKLKSGQATTYTIQYTETDSTGNAKYHWIDDRNTEVTDATLLEKLGVAGKGATAIFGGVNYSASDRRSYTIPSGSPDYLATAVVGTEQKNFTKVISIAVDGNVYAAAYASDSREVWIVKNDQVIKSIPVFAGLPSGSLELVWYPKASGQASGQNVLELVASGSDGIVTYDYKY